MNVEENTPPQPNKKASNPSSTFLIILALVAVGIGLIAVASPIILRCQPRSNTTQAINNAKDIYIGLRDYSFAHGSFPSSGNTSNEIFYPVFEAGNIVDEKPFYVSGVENVHGAKVGDENTYKANLLESGSNVFSYWVRSDGQGVDPATASPFAPLMSCPNLDNGAGVEFGQEVYSACFNGQAVILFVDGAAPAFSLDRNGKLDLKHSAPIKQELQDYGKMHVLYPKGVKKLK